MFRFTKRCILLITLPLCITLMSGEYAHAQTVSSTGYSVAVSTANVAPGGTVTVTWRAPSTHSTHDWIGLFLVGLPSSGATTIAYKYVPNGTAGTLSFKAPNTAGAQVYEFRYLLDNGFTMTATSNPITVTKIAVPNAPSTPSPSPSSSTPTTSVPTPPPPPSAPLPSATPSLPPVPSGTTYTLSASPVSPASGSTVTVLWKAPSTHAANDWIGLFLVGLPSAANTTIVWKYVPNGTGGTMSFTAPNTLIGQTYEFRYLLNNGFSEAAKSNPVNVSRSASATPASPPPAPAPPPPAPAPVVTAPPPVAAPPPPIPTSSSTSDVCPDGKPLAFPGAEGVGRCAQGGRGGPVIDVTSLADDWENPQPGTLRHCLETRSGPRICRPVVSGWVDLVGHDIVIRNDFVTLEPASGVQMGVKRAGIMVRANHTILRHIRVRPGTYQLLERVQPQNANGIFWMSTETGVHTHDNICDHCSISWGTDDLAGVIFGATNVTVQDSIIAEGLECIQCGGKGFGMGGNAMKADVIRSLFTNTYIRWPEISHGRARFINTVEYNTHGTPAQINPIYESLHISFIGNHFKLGPNGDAYPDYPPIRTLGGLQYSASSSIYVEGNYGLYWKADGTSSIGLAVPPKAIIWGDNGGIPVDASPATHFSDFPAVSVLDHQAAYDYVLDHAGAFPRDSTDTRIVNEVRTNTGRWKSSVEDAGGWSLMDSSNMAVAEQ